MYKMFLLISAFFTSFIITLYGIPSIIRVAEIKHLFDEPDERKTHKTRVPTLGGLAIFGGLIFSLTFWSSQKEIVELQYIISAIIILFFLGLKDDLFNLVAYKKLAGQLGASVILVHWGGIKITSFFGLFGVYDLSFELASVFSIFTIVVITNSINLIDGIDCLAGGIGLFASLVFGSWFFLASQTQYVILSFCLTGSLVAFLYFNRTPAKIFMGDTGSLIVGLVLSILSIKFIELNRVLPLEVFYKIKGVPVFTISILIIPLFDTLRVFTIRILRGRSPFSPDRNHLHHLLCDIGLSHITVTFLMVAFNAAIVFLSYVLASRMRSELVLLIVISICLSISFGLARSRNKKNIPRLRRDLQRAK